MGVAIGLDFWPARATLPDGTSLHPVRIWVVDGTVYVYIVANGEPVRYFESPFVSLSGSKAAGFSIDTEAGLVSARKDAGCGCGNPLKNYNPWPGERRERVKLAAP